MTSPRIWAQTGPEAAEGIARAVIDFAAQFLTEDHEDIADILRQRAAGSGRRCSPTRAGSQHAAQGRPSGNSPPSTAR
ncbi:hypothetical protein ACFU76_19690 [Streptomyces sp. NPDC057539]|uniref:hypothetical protein n=1 Tax=Streptomyces sp. NPDC057539 TaxID=3346159 RepID=UPI0036A8A3B2